VAAKGDFESSTVRGTGAHSQVASRGLSALPADCHHLEESEIPD
jgi:hypothetical protein